MNNALDLLKTDLQNNIKRNADALKQLSLRIHSTPELGFEETQAVKWLSKYMQNNGFTIVKNIAGLKSAFQASYGKDKPIIAFIGEYDALPDLGHACGHNLIATASAGAAVAAKSLIDKYGGQILFIGTPAEELFGGKIIMAERGIFDELDVAMMVHPKSGVDTATTKSLACITLYVEYFGKEAHAAAEPQKGRNALDAMVIAYTAISTLRQHIESTARIHGIIVEGGKATNIVPGYSSGNFLIRASDLDYLNELKERVLDCFRSGELATGAKLKYRWDPIAYEPLKNNTTLGNLFLNNMKNLGRQIVFEDTEQSFGSTDMGNVSQRVPSLHGFIQIAPKDVIGHTKEFACSAASEKGLNSMLDAAKALAMTAADLLSTPDLIQRVKQDFKSQ